MILIDDLKLTDIAAVSTLDDITTKYIYEAIDYMLQKRNSNVNIELRKLEVINLMNEQEINMLLWEYAIYPKNITLEEKKKMVKKAIFSKINMGTTKVLKDVCGLLYKGFDVKEWTEYNGRPGTFRIYTDKKITDSNEYRELIENVNANKNVRSHLDYVELKQSNSSNFFIKGYKEITLIATKENKKKDFSIENIIFIKGYKEIIGGITK
ncbi:phage tail protein [Fusobacterium animalis]|uniref:phage tail protein n=1 Tax=Fusobacterium animalis TaxID=76859 RepID=UPI0034DFBAFC